MPVSRPGGSGRNRVEHRTVEDLGHLGNRGSRLWQAVGRVFSTAIADSKQESSPLWRTLPHVEETGKTMDEAERDALALRHVEVLEQQARVLSELAGALTATEPPLDPTLCFPPPRRFLNGRRGATALLRDIPGFAGLWEQQVPADYVLSAEDRAGEDWQIVSCTCGQYAILCEGELGDCPCGRWFLHIGSSIRVKRFQEA